MKKLLCIFFIVVSSVANAQGLGVTYDQMTKGMKDYIPKYETAPLGTETRKAGMADENKAAAMLEMVGDAKNVNRAALVVIFVGGEGKDVLKQLMGNEAILRLYVKNTFPDWKEGPEKIAKLYTHFIQMDADANPLDPLKFTMVRGDKRITIERTENQWVYRIIFQHKSR